MVSMEEASVCEVLVLELEWEAGRCGGMSWEDAVVDERVRIMCRKLSVLGDVDNSIWVCEPIGCG